MRSRFQPERCLSALVPVFVIILLSAVPAHAALALNPDNCASYTVIPQMFEFYQSDLQWTGVAVGPLEPAYDTYLAAWSDEYGNGVNLGNSTYDGQTNFLVRNWTTAEHGYVEVFNVPQTNATFVIDWEPGLGELTLAQDVAVAYGGTGWDCGLFRVWDVTLTSGQHYDFSLETTQPDDDVRMALLYAGGDDVWLSRGQSLWEMALAPGGVETTHTFLALESGTYALVVFNNTVSTAGGTYTLRVEAASPDPEPDLMVSSIAFENNYQDESAWVEATITNMGGAAAGASTTSLKVGGTTVHTWSTGDLPAGNSAIVGYYLNPLPAGDYDIEVCADIYDTVSEADEDNNCDMDVLTMRLKPDLVIDHLDPDTHIEGSAVTATAFIYNQGAGDAEMSRTSISLDGTIVCGNISTPVIPAGQMVSVSCNLGILWRGTFDLSAHANVTSLFPETNGGNNTATEPLVIEPAAMADLVIDHIEPNTAEANTPITVTVYVRNQGGTDAPASSARAWVDGDIAAPWLDTPPVPAGQTVAAESFVIAGSWGGTIEVEAFADVGVVVPESDEGNNDRLETIEVAPPVFVMVYPDGSGDFPTIQAAVNALPAGVRIYLADGVFTGEGNRDIDFNGKEFEIKSLTGHEGLPVIDCQGGPEYPDLHRAFTFDSGQSRSARLYGLTIIGGWMNSGGAVSIGDAEPTIQRCIFRDNHANNSGGALTISSSVPAYPLITRCTFVGNYAQESGAIRLGGEAWPEVENCIIAYNGGYYGPVGVEPYSSANIALSCSDVYGNTSGDFVHFLDGKLGVDGNFSADPYFCDAGGDNYTLAHDSPCHNLQNIDCGWVGALEEGCGSTGQHVYLVKPDGTGDYPTIQLAIYAAGDGDVIELADGVFTGGGNRAIDLLGKAITIRSASGNSENCIIDPQGTSSQFQGGFRFYNGEGPGTVLESVTIRNGYFDHAGALYFGGSAPTINNVVVENCSATISGGAIWVVYGSSPVFNNCKFDSNTCDLTGGVIHVEPGDTATFNDCSFEGNSAATRGGVAYVDDAHVTFTGCTFRGNDAVENGGAVSYWNGSTGAVTDCFFTGNSAHGGGGFIFEDCAPAVSGCTFVGNSAAWGGAGYCNSGANPAITASTFHQNSGTNGGMAMSVVGSFPVLTRVLLTGQSGTGDVIACVSGSAVDLDCCDLYGNANGDYTGCLSGQLGVDGNISADPMYCPDNEPEEFAIHSLSPCAEDQSACGLIGAWPVGCGPQTYVVKADGSGDHPTIQAAIDAATAGSLILLSDGTFTGSGNRDVSVGIPCTIRSESGDPAACVIDCQGNETTPRRALTIQSVTGGTVLLADLTIRNGWRNYGGGVQANASDVDIDGCRFEQCTSSDGGGVFYTDAASGTVTDCLFTGNSASNAGGGLRVNPDCTVLVQDCDFEGNYGHWGGGALYAYYGTLSASGCLFDGNDSYAWGGAVHFDYGSGHEINNSTFYGNAAPSGGAIYLRHGASVTVSHCILASSTVGAATYCSVDSEVEFICNDVYGNAGGDYNNCIEGLEGVGGNISADPMFCDAPSGDFGLSAESPCAASGCGLQGARPVSCAFTLSVAADGSGQYPDIQSAIAAAADGDVIELGNGTYTGDGNRDLDTQGKRIRIRSGSGTAELVVIDCEGSAAGPHRAFNFQSGETGDTILENFTILNGHAATGGGIRCSGASPAIFNVRFAGCTADTDGGGLGCVDHSSPALTEVVFDGCSAGEKGGGLYATDFSSPVMLGCIFDGNQAVTRGGGAIFTVNSFPTLDACVFEGNTAGYGGGLAVVYSYGPVTGCSFFGNTASEGGGMYLRGNVQATFTGCSVAGNTTTGGGGAVSVLVNADPVFENCLLAYDHDGPGVHVDETSTASFSCSDIYGNAGGDWTGSIAGQLGVSGNISENPLLCGLSTGDLTVGDSSPCLPAGNSCGVQIGAHGEGCSITGVEDADVPSASFLEQNYPNPFNPITRIRLGLARPERVSLRIYDVAGRRIRTLLSDRELEAGVHTCVWDGKSDNGRTVASGIYFYKLRAGAFTASRKMILLR
ncbi:MAG: T9SS type A sorting domain-containing protein [Candidatus Krumholzibacteriota bacterium]|nr:T9SS type A sorting domain-containing protein [Candidatus Krumholzibacteriota bacterium]